MSLQKYLPAYYEGIAEMVALLSSQEQEIDIFREALKNFSAENTILHGSEASVALWEKFLGIAPAEDLQQRQMQLISLVRGQGKLNESKINDIVNAYTGAINSVQIDFVGSILRVRVLPPQWGEIFSFTEIEKALISRLPAHIGLVVERFYHTWGDKKESFLSWDAFKNSAVDWAEVRNKVEAN